LNLRDFALFTDENIHAEVVAFLRGEGFDVRDVKESGLFGADDLDLIRLAFADRRVFLTHDGDFGALAVVSGEPVIGLVYLRPGHISPAFTVETLRVLLGQPLHLNPPFLLVAERTASTVRVRIRNL
jgi:predicted nuclease of predicted toxin-antitoxin system